MKDYYDGDEPVNRQIGQGTQRDTEVTLGSGTIVGLLAGLVLLCGFCFWLGYTLGHHAAAPGMTATGLPTPAPEQEPLQATGAIPKPSALAQAPVAPQPAADGAQPAADGDENAEQGSAAESTQTPATAGAHPAASLIVQVAALANPDDAEVLVGALRKRGYQASAHREPGDGLIHVRIGPFASRELAEQWRQKLQSDGYNAVVQ